MGGSLTKESVIDSLSWFGPAPLHIVMLGLDGAGKTTALYRLKFNQYMNTVPTIGFNCEKIKANSGKCKGTSFLVWDVGGQDKLRPLWRSYTRGSDGIVFVVDATDVELLEEARVELLKTLRQPDYNAVPILVLANKQDLPKAKDGPTVEKLLGLPESSSGRLIHVQPACAITGDGLDEGIEKLYEMICKRKKNSKIQNKIIKKR